MGTHTYVKLEISDAAYKEISEKLRSAGYDHAFMDDGVIDMHGIGVITEPKALLSVRDILNEKLDAAVNALSAQTGVSRTDLLQYARELLANSDSKKA